MTHWLDPQPIGVPVALRETAGGHPLVAETMARRGICTVEAARAFLEPAAYTPAAPTDLADLPTAVERLRQAINRRERIAVWGDFDADGQTATAVLFETLRVLGADVITHVPGRNEGHGLHQPGLERLIGEGARLIVTCDSGVTAHAAVSRANALGAHVIVTDHHVLAEGLPPALAVVNPHRLPAGHPLRPLAGVGVAYQLARALNPAVAERSLDLVALGTVADVMDLTADNRYLVQRGLEILRQTNRPGLQAVYRAAELRAAGLTEEHIAYVLGPRLNALGRLADAAHGVELLTTGDPTRARTLATEVEALNARRQWLTKQVTDAALGQIERDPSLQSGHSALVLSHPSWPGGIIGVVAGRLVERFRKPAALITTPPGELARGSARSVPGVDLMAALRQCAHLLESFGGHAAAAGFSLEAERIPELRAALSRAVAAQVPALPEPELAIDAYVELPDLTLDLVTDLNRLAPFGPGNPPLVLAVRDLRVLSEATIGRTGEHRRLVVEDAHDRTQTLFWWQGAGWPLPPGRFDLALTVRASDYRGVADIQVEWLDARTREEAAALVPARAAVVVHDYRAVTNPEAMLQGFLAEGEVQVWAEGQVPAGAESRTRRELVHSTRLAIWTAPPGPRELEKALAKVQPEEVLLFVLDPGLEETATFLRQLASLVKYALRTRSGQMDLDAAASRLAHRASTVMAGLECLAAQGMICVKERQPDTWQLAAGTGESNPQALDQTRAHLDSLLAEIAAYRAYIRTAPTTALLNHHPLRADS